MAAFMTDARYGGKLRIEQRDYNIEFDLEEWELSAPFDAIDNFQPSFKPQGCTVRATGVVARREVKVVDDASRLAFAILDGNKDAALLAADEVQMRYLATKPFIPRHKLEARIRDLEERNADLERELTIKRKETR